MNNLAICEQIDEQLDELESKLPSLAANIVRVNRSIVARTTRDLNRVGTMFTDSASAIASAAGVGLRTVNGTAKWAVERTASTATTGARQTVGQARAQTKSTVETTNDELAELADDIDPTVDAALETLTKAELYDRAQARDIAGRSSMTKAQLVTALKR